MRKILLVVDLSSYSNRAIRRVLSLPLPLNTAVRVAMVVPKPRPPQVTAVAGRLAVPTVAWVVTSAGPPAATHWHNCQSDFAFYLRTLRNRAIARIEQLAAPLRGANYFVETTFHEGSVLLAIRTEVRAWCPDQVIVGVHSWTSIKRRILEFTFRKGRADNYDSTEGPPRIGKRAA